LKRKFNMEDSPPRLVQSLLAGCSNQRQVCTPPRPIISQGITFKDLLHGRHRSSDELRHVQLLSGVLIFPRIVCDEFRPPSSSACRSDRLASCLDGPFSPRLSSGHVESALRTPPILLLSVAEVALPSPRLPPPRHRPGFSSGSPLISPLKPIFPLPRLRRLLYSGHLTIFPASFISSMDFLQNFISSLLSSSRSSPPILPHQHFLHSDNIQLAPGSSY
ncbi:hypothetical protein AMECASPLE_038821, partial [Ameca splendens]